MTHMLIQYRSARYSEDRETGTATILIVALIACLALVSATILTSHTARGMRYLAQTSADLAALAGANQLHNGSGDPCQTVESVVLSNGATLSECVIAGDTVKIRVAYARLLFAGHAVSVAGPNNTQVREE